MTAFVLWSEVQFVSIYANQMQIILPILVFLFYLFLPYQLQIINQNALEKRKKNYNKWLKNIIVSLIIWRRNRSKLYRQNFNFNNHPLKSQIYKWTHKFWATGSVNNLSKKTETPRSGRKLSARTPVNLNAVRESVGKSSKKSIQRYSRELGLSRTSFQRILIKDLHLYP